MGKAKEPMVGSQLLVLGVMGGQRPEGPLLLSVGYVSEDKD